MIDLTGRRVLVTGGSRGIGAACCRLFARAGAAVFIQYQSREDAAAALLAELEGEAAAAPGAPGAVGAAASAAAAAGKPVRRPRHLACRCEISQATQVRAMFERVAAEWGGLDVLVNNAGIWVPNPLSRLDPARLAATLEINVSGAFLCAAAALPLLAESADGNIVNVTSTAGQRGEANYSDYAASKGAMISATKSWAVELAPRVRVNSVAPGWVDTDLTAEALAGERRHRAVASIPLGRIATAEDVAGPIAFLASPLARHITGEILNVNGGSVLAG